MSEVGGEPRGAPGGGFYRNSMSQMPIYTLTGLFIWTTSTLFSPINNSKKSSYIFYPGASSQL